MGESKYWKGDTMLAYFLGVTSSSPPTIKRSQTYHWVPPATGFKLNVDASFKDGMAGLGGILRDPSGGVVAVVGTTQLLSLISKGQAHWSVQQKVAHICHLWHTFRAEIAHVVREQNMAADMVAKMARSASAPFEWDRA
ncbi:hypothetical protein LIER_22797 [Lithospermum erythrorhizon]|uniref:RNase H type-1 domain-containing protein n=1 Tax=Lithospermum erythrorhizon TaxID=34254 RepID=A0AAV3QZC0_LITER